MRQGLPFATGTTVDPDYFRELFRSNPDPWNFTGSDYERRKYQASLDVLPRARYERALELACANGVFTSALALRCDDVLAVDVSADALRDAAVRCAHLPNVRFACVDLGRTFPDGRYDLITLCEVGFYFGEADLRRLHDAIAGSLGCGGTLLMVHWTPHVVGHASTADDVHDMFGASSAFTRAGARRESTYRLDVLTRR